MLQFQRERDNGINYIYTRDASFCLASVFVNFICDPSVPEFAVKSQEIWDYYGKAHI